MELAWNILEISVIALLVIIVWGFFGLFVASLFKNLKKMPKPPQQVLVDPKWVSLEEYKAILDAQKTGQRVQDAIREVRHKETVPPPFDQDMEIREYDAQENPWNERNISAKGQNNV